jgi:two-component system cell cycle response regulator DivK
VRQPIVLVSDDDPDTRELYRACLDTCGYRTAEARNGSQTIVTAMELVPDVLLADYVLPDIDGVTIARRLKQDPRTAGIHILIVTGYAQPDIIQQAVSAGVERVLLKPCLPQAVMREVARVMAKPAAPTKVLPADGLGGATRVRQEFAALPGLALTAEQARLVFDLERDAVEPILQSLVAEGFLSRTPMGAYRRQGTGSGRSV